MCSSGYGGEADAGAGCTQCSAQQYKASSGDTQCTDVPDNSKPTADRTDFGKQSLIGFNTNDMGYYSKQVDISDEFRGARIGRTCVLLFVTLDQM